MARLNTTSFLRLFITGLLTITPLFSADKNSSDTFTSSMSVLSNPGTFNILVNELQATKINTLLEKNVGEKKVTLLAPTDAALNVFGQLGALRGSTLDESFLKFHILYGLWPRKRLRANRTAKTLAEKPLNLKDIGKILYSIETDNGIIHVIDKVVIHPDIKKKLNLK
jgi:uncharacterized surface protein with fasciclin (FAS1) repeats